MTDNKEVLQAGGLASGGGSAMVFGGAKLAADSVAIGAGVSTAATNAGLVTATANAIGAATQIGAVVTGGVFAATGAVLVVAGASLLYYGIYKVITE